MITIRPFEPADRESVLALWHNAKRKAFPYVEAQQRYTLEEDRAFFEGSLLFTCRVWIAEEAGEPVGFMALREGWIDHIFVRVDRQGQGIGSALLDKAKELAEGDLNLMTYQRNHAARALYERHGFEAVAFGVSPPPENEPDVHYRWRA
ncbi:MAG TPA: GNAT family N-acetyltransferase [Thermoanaerobaculia bacterium]|nr:GNAT family N-acetyltransferase [Thermoanaerobaculia bacterium]